jgi:UDPglucose 6-dehydrogenase
MEIAIIGTGYVGMVTGTCLADLGHSITFVDIDTKKIESLRKGISPIFEPGLAELLEKNQDHITATLDLSQAVHSADLTMITVGTPSRQDGSLDLSYVTAAVGDI